METGNSETSSLAKPKWRKVAYGGMQPGFDDNHTDDSFLEDMVMNANVVKRDMLKACTFCLLSTIRSLGPYARTPYGH
ncbi:hypothetical protein F0562_026389 [Nyssa sinensis]|uniref:Uncharacterized protein n=1 Tax=Nyssa sinensis TaxID=561372 RepID=A0A5J5BD96_9ASTE|nr:hypothetical protein F0562_026389 [Nyssa sinensis]